MRSRLTSMATAMALISSSVFFTNVALGDERMTMLLKQPIDAGMEANMVRIEADPGYQTERHLHPGHVFIYVLEGTLELDVDGEDPIRLSAGEAGYETPNKPMIGRNASSTEGLKAIVFQIGEAGKPMQVAQPN